MEPHGFSFFTAVKISTTKFYIITRLKTHDQIDEFFETLKRVFMDALDESHPPPCNQVIAVLHTHRQAYSKLKQLA